MNKNYSTTYPLYDTSYGNDYPLDQLFVLYFNSIPSKLIDGKNYNKKILNYFLSRGFKFESKIALKQRKNDNNSIEYQVLLVNSEKQIIIRTFNEYDKEPSLRMEVTYNIGLGELSEQLDFEEIESFETPVSKSGINLIKNHMGHLDIEEYDLPIPQIDLELNYGESFLKVHNKIVERLNKNFDKGIVLLHGDPGTGKTSYIKYLTSLIKDKYILFIPPSMAETLSEPNIIPFLMDHKNSILIIEDAEKVISDREINGSSAGVSNILNLTDGILGDCLNIQIIATFNMKREKIDTALLRKGRLIAEHKFQKLNVEETNKLLKALNKDYVSKEPMSLADIYNVDVEVYKTDNKINKIGFHG